MNTLAALFVSLVLLVPSAASDLPPVRGGGSAAENRHVTPDAASEQIGLPLAAPARSLPDAYRTPAQNQVRIEQRVIIRISPARPAPGHVAQFSQGQSSQAPVPVRVEERELDGCIPIQSIAGVQSDERNRLLLFMRDMRVLSAALERACSARDFYQGFYVERSEDGMLCAGRDKLQSRAGASCEVKKLNRLIAVRD